MSKSIPKPSVLILLDLSAGFDTVNYQILPPTYSDLGIKGKVLWWLQFNFTGRSFRVSWRGEVSESNQLITGVPQGSVLGPLLFFIYTGNNHKGLAPSSVIST